jgi:hypothetical protein
VVIAFTVTALIPRRMAVKNTKYAGKISLTVKTHHYLRLKVDRSA